MQCRGFLLLSLLEGIRQQVIYIINIKQINRTTDTKTIKQTEFNNKLQIHKQKPQT